MIINGHPVSRRMPIFTQENRDLVRTGKKTQTRRVMNPQPVTASGGWGFTGHDYSEWEWKGMDYEEALWNGPYSEVGDIYTMREPLKRWENFNFIEYADTSGFPTDAHGLPQDWRWPKSTHISSMFMPADLGRTLVRYTSFWAAPLQSISEEDALAEGIHFLTMAHDSGYTIIGRREVPLFPTAVAAYASLWDEINGKTHPWAANPWVWCLAWEWLCSS